MIRLTYPFLAVLGLVAPAALQAQDDEEDLGWHDTAELTFVLTEGNASSTTFGFKNALEHVWPNAKFRFGAGGIRVESTTFDRTAVGDPDDFRVEEIEDSEVTAESYYLRTRYDRDISEALFWYAGTGWSRNTFAGIDSRVVTVGGLGNTWYESEVSAFRTDYGLTYTSQDNVDGSSTNFGGVRVSWEYWRDVTDNTRFESVLIVDENFDESSDLRADLLSALAVAMNQHLSLKVSYQVLFDNDPSLEAIPLFAVGGDPTGVDVLTPLDELDTIFTIGLVIGF